MADDPHVTRNRDDSEGRVRYAPALRRTLRTTAVAYGYTLMIATTTAILTSVHGSPTTGDCVLFATGGLLAFALLEGVVTIAGGGGEDLPEATAFVGVLNVISVVGGLGAAIGVARGLSAWAAWLLAPLAGTVLYMQLVSVQIVALEAWHRRRCG